jgi:hypothetical protein
VQRAFKAWGVAKAKFTAQDSKLRLAPKLAAVIDASFGITSWAELQRHLSDPHVRSHGVRSPHPTASCAPTHIHTHTHTHIHTHAYTLIHTRTRTHIHTRTHTHTHAHTYTQPHTHAYTHVHTRTRSHVHTYTHIHTHTHTTTHTHARTRTHAHTHTRTHAHTHHPHLPGRLFCHPSTHTFPATLHARAVVAIGHGLAHTLHLRMTCGLRRRCPLPCVTVTSTPATCSCSLGRWSPARFPCLTGERPTGRLSRSCTPALGYAPSPLYCLQSVAATATGTTPSHTHWHALTHTHTLAHTRHHLPTSTHFGGPMLQFWIPGSV